MSVYKVKKLNRPISAEISVPGSKSITNRALLISALSEGTSVLYRPLFSDDTESFLDSLTDLGFLLEIVRGSDPYIRMSGMSGSIPKQKADINVRSAGTSARFLTALLASSNGEYYIDASEQMKKRPMKPLFDALIKLGASFEYGEKEFHLPAKVRGCFFPFDKNGGSARVIDGKTVIGSDQSTQFISALLMIAPVLAERTGTGSFDICVEGARSSGSYIMMTVKMMEQFGVNVAIMDAGDTNEKSLFKINSGQSYKPENYVIEPDVSAACYFYAAAAVTGGKVIVDGVHKDSLQGDIKFLDVLERMGCTVRDTAKGVELHGPPPGKLMGVDADMKDFADQTMTLAAIAPFCNSVTKIKNIGHIKLQESDRIAGIVTELGKMGIRVETDDSDITIFPGKVHPAVIDTYDDHRMAMAFSLTGLMEDGIIINDYECCSKTFKNYFEVLETIY